MIVQDREELCAEKRAVTLLRGRRQWNERSRWMVASRCGVKLSTRIT